MKKQCCLFRLVGASEYMNLQTILYLSFFLPQELHVESLCSLVTAQLLYLPWNPSKHVSSLQWALALKNDQVNK